MQRRSNLILRFYNWLFLQTIIAEIWLRTKLTKLEDRK